MKSDPQCQNNQKYYPYPKPKSSVYTANVYDNKLKQRTVNKNVYHNKLTNKSETTSPINTLLPPANIGHTTYIKSPLAKNIDLDNVSNLNDILLQDKKQQRTIRRSNTWLYTLQQLQTMKKPCKVNISFEEELIQRAKAIHFIKNVCFKLGLGHHVLSAASILLHRYYVRRAIQDSQYQDIASACVFLARKLFESKDMCPIDKLVVTCAKVSMKNNDYDVPQNIFDTWKRNIIHNEMEILKVVCYDLDIEIPTTYIQKYTNTLKTSKKLKKYIYCVINDCLTTTLCLRYRWSVIVAAALYVSSKMIGEQINCNNNKWWLLFSINENEMKNIIREILIIYQNEIDNISDRLSPMASTHLNVMSPPLSNPHPSQVSSLSTLQLKNELDKAMPYSSEKGMIPGNVGSNQIPPSPTLSETSESSLNKKLSRKISYDSTFNERASSRKGIDLQSYLKNIRATAMKN